MLAVVLFYDPTDTFGGLSDLLRQKEIDVREETQVRPWDFDGGRLVVCCDAPVVKSVKEDITRLVSDVKPERCFLLYHIVTREEQRAYGQRDLASELPCLSGKTKTLPYHHHVDTEPFKELLSLLTNGAFSDPAAPFSEAVAAAEAQEMSVLKHRMMRLFSALDVDLQGLWDEAQNARRTAFDPDYWSEVFAAHKDTEWDKRFDEVSDMLDASKADSTAKRKLLNLWDDAVGLISSFRHNEPKQTLDLMTRRSREPGGHENALHEFLAEFDRALDGVASSKAGQECSA
jgi:hypothetical protein